MIEKKITKMTKQELEKLAKTIQSTINNAPMLSDTQEQDLTNSLMKVLEELNNR